MVEVLAVITIICLIGLITFPAINSTMKKMEEREYQRYLDDIYLATETYIGTHHLEYENLNTPGQTVTIPVSNLIEEELLKKNIIDPQTEQPIKENAAVKVTIENDMTRKYTLITK